VLVKATGQILTSNQLEFEENFFPFWKKKVIERLGDVDEEIDILVKASAPIRWLKYDPAMRLGTFKRVNIGSDSHLILQLPTKPNAYLNIDQATFFANLMATTSVHQKAMMAVEPLTLTRVNGL
jgi:hypothetical protein